MTEDTIGTPAVAGVGERPVAYAPRTLTALPAEKTHGWIVKRYAVSALRERPPEEVLAIGRRAIDATLPAAYPDAPSCAYTVVHEDEDGCYAVVGWWSRNGLILHTRTWLAGWGDLESLTPAPGYATACVWELVPMAHERQAWVRHVLRPDEPDLEAYLQSTVSGRF